MPETARKLSSRWTDSRPIALLLALGALSLGLQACGSSGSDSSTGTAASTSTVVRKEAGVFGKDVQLTVINDTAASVDVTLCVTGGDPASCEDHSVAAGASADKTWFQVAGTLHLAPEAVSFEAINPDVQLPLFYLQPTSRGWPMRGGAPSYSLVEGEVVRMEMAGHDLQLERRGDTDVKVMRIIILS